MGLLQPLELYAKHNPCFPFILSYLTSGRILNRFSKDIGQLDSKMPWIFVDFIQVKASNKQELPPQPIITFWTCSRTKVLLFNIHNIHFLFWPVVLTNPGCNCCVSIGHSLDFDPCASPPPRLHLPSPLLPADFTRCEAPWVNQWVLPSATLKIRFCAFFNMQSWYPCVLLILQLEVRSSPTCPHLFKACGPSEHFMQRTGSRKPLMTIKTCIHVRNSWFFVVSRRIFDHRRVIYLFVQR